MRELNSLMFTFTVSEQREMNGTLSKQLTKLNTHGDPPLFEKEAIVHSLVAELPWIWRKLRTVGQRFRLFLRTVRECDRKAVSKGVRYLDQVRRSVNGSYLTRLFRST